MFVGYTVENFMDATKVQPRGEEETKEAEVFPKS